MKNNIETYRNEILEIYEKYPFQNHPFWRKVLDGNLSRNEIIAAEIQHYKRSKRGAILRVKALEQLSKANESIYERLLKTYLEECTETDGTPTHLELAYRLAGLSGKTQDEIEKIDYTPGNIASIALYEEISSRGAESHMIGAGIVEFYYSELCPKNFQAYTNIYGFTENEAETYRIHGTMDQEHSQRALESLEDIISIIGYNETKNSVRDALIATSLHYDGMLQAATNIISFWNYK